jgi:hypothetical protein
MLLTNPIFTKSLTLGVIGISLVSLLGYIVYLGFEGNNQDFSAQQKTSITLTPTQQDEIGKTLASTRIFMYHGFETEAKYNDFLKINIADFKDQINWLIANGYSFTTTDKIIELGIKGQLNLLPTKRVILQLDDGYSSNLLANDAVKEIKKLKNIPIPLEIGMVQDNIGRSNNHLTLNNYYRLQSDGNSVVSHTKSHCSLGDETILNPTSGTDKKLIGNTSGLDCQFYPKPNEGYFKPLDLEFNKNQIISPAILLRDKLKINTPALIYPYGHNSKQNIAVMKEIGVYFGFNTAFQPVCNKDLQSNWVSRESNYNIKRTTVNGLQKWKTDARSWFYQAENSKCM